MTWLDAVSLETVIVHVTDGPSLKGLREVVHDDCLVLRDALVFHEEDAPQQLDGLLVVPREKVLFVQVVV